MPLILSVLLLLLTAVAAQGQPIPIIHPNPGGGMGGGGGGGIGGGTGNNCGSTDRVCNANNFGADPTGATDAEPAMMAAQTFALSKGYNGIYVPAGNYKLGFPLWIKGDANFRFNLTGAGGRNSATKFFNDYVLVGAYNQWSLIDGGCGAGNLWTTPLIGATGQSICDNQRWFLDLKQVASGYGTGTFDAPFNGLSAFTVEFWFNATNSVTGGWWILKDSGTDGAEASAFGPFDILYTWNGSTGTLSAHCNLTGGVVAVATAANATLAGTTHFYQLVYNGSNVQWYVDGVASGSSVGASGTTVDKPYINAAIGSGLAWPTPSASQGFLGKLFGFRLSKTARVAANPAVALTCDSNTLLLLNGTTVNSDETVASTSGPFVRPECLNGVSNPADSWLLMHAGVVSGALTANLSGFEVQNISPDGYGMVGSQINTSSGRDLYFVSDRAPAFTLEDNAYLNRWDYIVADSNTLINFLWMWPGNICTGCTSKSSDYQVVDTSGESYYQMYANLGSTAKGCLVSVGLAQTTAQEDLTEFQCDNENGSTAPDFAITSLQVNIKSSFISTGATVPTILVGDKVSLGLINDNVAGPGLTQTSLFGSFAGASVPNALIRVDQSQFDFAAPVKNAVPVTDGNGEQYEFSGMGATKVTGTTAGSAEMTCPVFSDNAKTCVVNLAAYENTTATAQLIMVPNGATSFGTVATDTGTCTNVTMGTGSNTGCTASATPYPCCSGSGTGQCNTLQFVTLPSSMGGTQTGVCKFVGN